MLWLDCNMLETVRGRRRPRGPARKLSCSFWFLLLFGAGGLVLFIHLQDLADMVQLQAPGVKFTGMTRQTREEMCAQQQDSEAAGSAAAGRTGQGGRPEEPSADHAVSPMPFPAFAWDRVSGTPGSREHELGPPRVTKRRRKLLKTSPVLRPASNSSAPPSSPPPSPPSLPGSNTAPPGRRRLSLAQEERRHLMQNVCARYRADGSRTVTPHHVSRVYVEDRHRLLYCEVPKAGCSNWKRVLMVLSGAAPLAGAIDHDAVHYGNHLKRLDSFDRAGIARRLRFYTKVLFVREPMERLVSAFRDKFESPNSYYHPVFGKPIISRYRANASKVALKTGSGVTFPEFIRYLLDVHRPVGMDIHWEPVSQLCSPCLLDYDFIGKFETIEEEADFVLRQIGAPRNLTFPTFKDRNPKAARTSAHMTEHYFSQLSTSDRQRAYDFYYMDYLMFNYSKPFQDLY
ncbi:carbohydrate sulfotransferase 8 [Electrophorus electricus]|uniref:carbohydrate sulfotransferase 8 n=1 Tax=Electrophorus electricus TaxID=8005 RepID=UPI0015CFC5E6|nr:carbohydrate sulfotransferase 8 [Electrophorus electricus]XP_035380823.1 carbohydrate sulfotransferase 8 [Electrophorus electricus]XP_035380824.1 carbohydrate sulfotransferase 8 [Electrophorus electricus]XP_035380825.1 carbohydrate sulfotransferase 8 [Electrophorus electricus]